MSWNQLDIGDNMQKNEWDNITNRDNKEKSGQNSYGLNNNKTGFFSIKSHTVNYGDSTNKNNIFTYVVCSTFDAELVVLENSNPFGKYGRSRLDFKEKVRMRTHNPIANSLLEIQENNIQSKHYLIAYFIDIFSNIYEINLTNYFEWNQNIALHLQPIKFHSIFQNLHPCNQDLIYEQPRLLYKHRHLITTINLGGTLRILDLTQDKSWIKALREPKVHQFKDLCLSAASSRHTESNAKEFIVIVLNNRQLPYPFVDCESQKDYKQQADLIDRFYCRWKENSAQIIACEYDTETGLVATSLVTQEIELYELKKHQDGQKTFYVCQTIYRFFPISSTKDTLYTIEHINVNRGILSIVTSQEYILFDLLQKTPKKRGKRVQKQSKNNSNTLEKLKWIVVTELDKSIITYIIAKGYNHHNESQSRLGKPSMHFKQLDLSAFSKG